ncbi:MAG: acetyl-CoA carboxylase biotin carboxyl carrier protein [Bacteroidota bacterium]
MAMDAKSILEILKFVNKSDLIEVEIEGPEFSIKARRPGAETIVQQMHAAAPTPAPQSAPQPQQQAPAPQPVLPTPPPATSQAPSGSGGIEQKAEEGVRAANHKAIKSPMVGTFYRKPDPDQPAFVKVGDTISAGDTVCIIEAMKLFNEIESEFSGKIVEILVEDQQAVEYDQELFIVEV